VGPHCHELPVLRLELSFCLMTLPGNGFSYSCAQADLGQVVLPRNMSNRVARKFVIRGEVQGVGYRFFAQRAAARHQIVGYVRNCSDGTVEAVAEGPEANVEAFKHDLATGPAFAVVAQVEETHLDPTGSFPAFRIER
jgi:acylphosphatase